MVATLEVSPGPRPGTVRTSDGQVLDVPAGWEHLPPGDALLTRRVKASGPVWVVSEVVRNKRMSRGIWAPAERIAAARGSVEATRATPDYHRQLAAGRARRARAEAEYVLTFARHVHAFLGFHASHAALADELARRVAEHATPVGSGTVARTQRIPVEQRAEAAVIAWLRHQTTAYDNMSIPRVAGARHEVRRRLAERSRALLERYRRGLPSEPGCPLVAALAPPGAAGAPKVTRPAGTVDDDDVELDEETDPLDQVRGVSLWTKAERSGAEGRARRRSHEPERDYDEETEDPMAWVAAELRRVDARLLLDDEDDGEALVTEAVQTAQTMAQRGDPELDRIREAEDEAARRAARQAIVRQKLARRPGPPR